MLTTLTSKQVTFDYNMVALTMATNLGLGGLATPLAPVITAATARPS